MRVAVDHLPNPRVEKEEHYYNAANTRLRDLGLQPHYLSDTLLESVMRVVLRYGERIRAELIMPAVDWRRTSNATVPAGEMLAREA
jgi:UDP-sulfoquinovose synthase